MHEYLSELLCLWRDDPPFTEDLLGHSFWFLELHFNCLFLTYRGRSPHLGLLSSSLDWLAHTVSLLSPREELWHAASLEGAIKFVVETNSSLKELTYLDSHLEGGMESGNLLPRLLLLRLKFIIHKFSKEGATWRVSLAFSKQEEVMHFSSHLFVLLIGEEGSRSREHSWSREIHKCAMLNLTEVGIKNDPQGILELENCMLILNFSLYRKKLKSGDSFFSY